MRVTFLGTGTSQGVPPIGCTSPVCLSEDPRDKRLRSSLLIEIDGKNLVIDAGPDFRYQMIRAGVARLDAILFTHEHRDHTAGLDDIRPFNYRQQAPIPVYLHSRVLESLKGQFAYLFAENPYPGIPDVDFRLIENAPFTLDGIDIIPLEVMHYRLPVMGFRFGSFAYVTDANYIAETELDKLKGVEVLVLNALRLEPHISHFTLSEAVEMANKVGAKQTYFTHMSHQIGFHEAVCKELPSGIDLAYDGLVLNLD
ncbi:MAG: MBL fold metallo-hydrolase [Bacteroidia bacterium]